MSVNAPESGTVSELLAKEEDTVTVGQDLVKLELGGAPEGKKEDAAEQPKEPAPEKSQPSEPEKQETKTPPPPPEQPSAPKPEPSKPQAEAPKPAAPKPEPTSDAKPAVPGTREERRVCPHNDAAFVFRLNYLTLFPCLFR